LCPACFIFVFIQANKMIDWLVDWWTAAVESDRQMLFPLKYSCWILCLAV